MTPKERAQWIIDHYRHIGPEDSLAIMSDIEAAIEEDRKTRDCCKAEREACAGIADEVAAFLRDNKLSGLGDVEYVALVIRARSDS